MHSSFLTDGLILFTIILLRYFLVAGGSYLLLYRQRPDAISGQRTPTWEAMRHDIQLSVLSAGIFALAAALMRIAHSHGLTRIYSEASGTGLGYAVASYLLVLVLQDAYFYATHRLFHHPALFRRLHEGHHRSRCPTPWTSFAFDPAEAMVQSLFLAVIICLIPLHVITLIAVLSTMTIWAVVNHLGLDRLPLGFPHHWLGRWMIGPTHHGLHHQRHAVHFGLYFTYWDQLCGTQDPSYGTASKPTNAPGGAA